MYTNPTVADFKIYFMRDFPFAPIITPEIPEVPEVPEVPEIIEDLLAIPPIIGVPAVPAIPAIPAVPAVYSDDFSKYILNVDIEKAMNETDAVLNPCLFVSQESFNIGFLLLSAHNLCMNLRASSQGLSGGFDWLVSSKGVGSVSESISIPSSIQENPMFAAYATTSYGARYIMMIWPRLMGQIFTVQGGTNA